MSKASTMDKLTIAKRLGSAVLAGALICAPGVLKAQSAEPETSYVALPEPGVFVLELQDGNDHVSVKLSLSSTSSGWPEGSVVGGSSDSYGSTIGPYRIVSRVDLRVNDCLVFQPTPPISGFALPEGATLSVVEGGWELDIGGSDGAESYGVRYTFDRVRVLARDLGWGNWHETTRYDIDPGDPEVFGQPCGDEIG